MSHEIDNTLGMDAIAYVGEKPWHGLGQELTRGADIETWKRQAGLDWTVMRADVKYDVPVFKMVDGQSSVEDKQYAMKGRSVLYRSDTHAALSVMSTTRYNIVQPAEVLEFFGEIASVGGFELEVAGALKGGKKIWATARVGAGSQIIGRDHVRPFLLFHTSFDGSAATTVSYVEERAVCANTIRIALDESIISSTVTGLDSSYKVNHSKKFDADEARTKLGIVHQAHTLFVERAQLLTEKGVSDKTADDFVVSLLSKARAKDDLEKAAIRDTRGFRQIISLFNGNGLLGKDIDGGKNAWRLLNAITQQVDHERGKNRDSGLDSAWFGAGSNMKTTAMEQLLAL